MVRAVCKEVLGACGERFFSPPQAVGKKKDIDPRSPIAGYTLVELLLATIVGSIILAATYASYLIVARQQSRIWSFAEVQEAGVPTLRLISRDLRMAGHKALDAAMESPYGKIDNPIVITDSGNACCDSIVIIYDKSTTDRQRITYSTAQRANPIRNALYMIVDTWDGAAWNNSINQALVTDYVEDLQFVGSDPDDDGNSMIVDVSLILRNKLTLTDDRTYTKNAYDVGNYNINITDKFFRDEFNATVNIRNLR